MTAMIPINEVMPSHAVWQGMKQQAGDMIKSGFLPASIKTPEQVLVIALKGRELGLPTMYALAHIHVIQGKPAQSSESMLARILSQCPGTIIHYEVMDADRCVMQVTKPAHKAQSFSFTMDDAKRAGLLTKTTWQQYPKSMLRARCISDMARALFPEALGGISHTPEELGATVNEQGEVIDVQVTTATETKPAGFNPSVGSQKAWLAQKASAAGLDDIQTEKVFTKMVGRPASEADLIIAEVTTIELQT